MKRLLSESRELNAAIADLKDDISKLKALLNECYSEKELIECEKRAGQVRLNLVYRCIHSTLCLLLRLADSKVNHGRNSAAQSQDSPLGG